MTDERKSEIKQWLRDTISELTYGSMNIVVSSCAYDDVFDASTIAEAYNEAEYIDTFLDDKLYYSDREYELFDEISSKSEKKSLDFKNEFLDFCKDYDYNVPEILEAGGFEGVSNDIESFFDSYRVNIMFATRTEQNSDMTSITYAYPRDYGDVNVQAYTEEVYKDITDNALTYLVHQQGHSILEVYNAMSEVYDTMNSEKNSSDSFIDSVAAEIIDASHDMEELTACLTIPSDKVVEILEKLRKKEGYIVIPKGSTIGLFNEWSGAGSTLDIQLEKDAVFPASMMTNLQFESRYKVKENNGFTVDEVYGLIGSCWKAEMDMTDEAPELVKEDLSLPYKHFIKAAKEHNEIERDY